MSSLYPKSVEVEKEQLIELARFFTKSKSRILSEVTTATSFGVKNRKAIIKQIDQILLELGKDIQGFLDKNVPPFYKDGADHAVRQLKNVGVKLRVTKNFNQLHKDSIVALIDSTFASYAEAITGVKRSANRLLDVAKQELVQQEIAHGVVTGDALRTVRRNIKGLLVEDGLPALIDKAGRKWELDRYSEMLFRTKTSEARNLGLANRMVENGYDLVQVSSHGATDVCGPWEGKILSVTGDNKKYPSVAEATEAGLFHPNCRHVINTLIPSVAKKTRAYDPNSGQLIKKSGESLKR